MEKVKKMKTTEIDIPDEIEIEKNNGEIEVSGPNGTVRKDFSSPRVSIIIDENTVTLKSENKKKALAVLGTFESELENSFKGVKKGFEYRLKVLYSHFPMQVEVKNDKVEIRNFLGEKEPRYADIIGETEVEINDEEIVVRGPNKQKVGQTAANIEQVTYVNDKDVRVFQDGIYIVEKE